MTYIIYIYMYVCIQNHIHNIHSGYLWPTCRPKERSSWERHWPGGSGPQQFEKCWMKFEVTTTKEQNNKRTYENNDELCCKSIDVCTFVYIYIYTFTCIDWLLEGICFKKKTPFPPNWGPLHSEERKRQLLAPTLVISTVDLGHGWCCLHLKQINHILFVDVDCVCVCVMPVLFFPFTEKNL